MGVGLLQALASIGILVFSVCTMLTVGLSHTLRELLGPLRDSRGLMRALLANFVLVPLLAYGVVQVVPLDRSYATGVMLIGTGAGALFLVRLTAVAGGNMPLSASLTVLLMLATVLYMPLMVPRMVPDVSVRPAAIALPLLWTMILPLGAGLYVRARHPALAQRLRPGLSKLAMVALAVLFAATLVANFGGVVRIIRTGAILAPLILIPGAFGIGWVLGREYRGGHVVLGLGTGQRNIAAAMVVATQGMGDQNAELMVVVSSLVGFAVLFPIAWLLARRSQRRVRALNRASV